MNSTTEAHFIFQPFHTVMNGSCHCCVNYICSYVCKCLIPYVKVVVHSRQKSSSETRCGRFGLHPGKNI